MEKRFQLQILLPMQELSGFQAQKLLICLTGQMFQRLYRTMARLLNITVRWAELYHGKLPAKI